MGTRIAEPLRRIVRSITSMMMSGDITTVTTVGGSTTSSIEATQPDRSATCEGAAVEAVMRKGVVSMRVIDNGPGVSEDIEPDLFNRYPDGGGRALLSGSIGLGTAVAAAYAESFGGTIEYLRDSERTVFEVRLPAVISDAVPALV